MKRRLLWLAAAGLVRGNAKSFSINDDLLAFPQYEMVFSEQYIGDTEAESRIASSFSSLAAEATKTGSPPSPSQDTEAAALDLSTRTPLPNDERTPKQEPEAVSQDYERMVLDSRPYLCAIPQVDQTPKNETEGKSDIMDDEKELARASDRGLELLQDMEGHCMYYMSGWWSYAFCYQNEVKQFHPLPPGKGGVPAYPPIEDEEVPAYILGHFEGRRPPVKQVDGGAASDQKVLEPEQGEQEQSLSRAVSIQTKGEMRYMVQNLTGGTICDLTGKPRKVEVQFHCHPQSNDRIGWIKETATCSYLMVIYTPRLCNDVAFLPPKESKAAQIVCREIVPEAELESRQQRRAAEAERKLLSSSSKAPSRPVVGGIEVGGMKQVGQEGKRITAPQAVDQVPSKGELIARWDPEEDGGRVKQLSDADLRDMDLDPKIVENMRHEIHKKAKGKAWSLEVIEMGNGVRQLVGVVDGEDADEQQEEQEEEEAELEKEKELEKEVNREPVLQQKQAKQQDTPPPTKEDPTAPAAAAAAAAAATAATAQDNDEGEGPEEGSKEVFKDEL